jgi:branched-chain amino acid transport system substrate-binding protein
MSHLKGKWKLVLPLASLVAVGVAVVAASASAAPKAATPLKLAILSDCQGAFGAFYEPDIGGAQAAFAKFGGGKPVDPKKPSAGMTGITLGGTPVKIVGYGCSNDTAAKAISETKRLMEKLGADIMIGPLSGDEGIAVANYAKRHPTKTFLNGTSGAQDTTLKVRAPNFFRFNGDGAQWSAGLGDVAVNKLGWKTAAAIADDYSFAWTSSGGQIAEFCGLGGKITKRVYPPLNTTDYSSYVAQLPPPSQVDGYFWAVGGAGLVPSLKAFEQRFGPLPKGKFIGNLFWSDPLQYKELSDRVSGAFASGPTDGELKTPAAKGYTKSVTSTYPTIAPFVSSVFVYNYYNAAWALSAALTGLKGQVGTNQSALQKALSTTKLPQAGYGPIKLDANRQAIAPNFVQQLQTVGGKLTVKNVLAYPAVDQSFGGTFTSSTPPPGRTSPTCTKRSIPWAGKGKPLAPIQK